VGIRKGKTFPVLKNFKEYSSVIPSGDKKVLNPAIRDAFLNEWFGDPQWG
jgi:hypothetical protein